MNYKKYKFSIQDHIKSTVIGIGICILLGWLFYRSMQGIVVLSPCILFYRITYQKRMRKKQDETLKIQFQDAMASLSAAMQAGYSAEGAIKRAVEDMLHQYEEDDIMIREFRGIETQLRNNRTLEEEFYELASRTDVEDIKLFAEVFAAAKRSGGNVVKTIQMTLHNMEIKNHVQKEIETMLAGKMMEVKIMNMMPLGILLYLRVCSPELIAPLYHNMPGILIMTFLLVSYITAYLWSIHILKIKI